MGDTEKGIKMISAATEVLNYKKKHIGSSNEEIMNHVANKISNERDNPTRFAMIGAASRALSLSERNPGMSDREIIKDIVAEISSIIHTVESHS